MELYQRLEQEWAQFNNLDPAGMVVCSSGTAALHLAIEALDLPRCSEVIVPDYTMIACPRAVSMAGMVPVFVDCDEKLLMDSELMRHGVGDCKNRNTSAMMPVSVYGRSTYMERLHDIAEPRGLSLIEDLAEAHGVEPHHLSDAACWSFYQNKIVAGEEGGAVWFRNKEHADRSRSLRCLGMGMNHDYQHIPRGHNYRMSDVHAELVLQSLWKYDENVEKRRQIEQWYDEMMPRDWRMPHRDAPWVYDVRIPGMIAEQQRHIVVFLRSKGVEARYGFKPMHTQEEYQGCRVVGGKQAEQASREVIYLPLTPTLTRQDIEHAVCCLLDVARTLKLLPSRPIPLL